MKKLSIIVLAGMGLFLASCNKNSTPAPTEEQEVAEQQGDVFAVDTTSSVVNWKAFHKGGFAPRWGTLSVTSGELSLGDGQLSAGAFVIDMKSLKVDPASVTEKDKNYAELEGHLKSADFFDVEKNPTAEFKVTKVADLAAGTTDAVEGANKTISGNLTLQGKTLNVSFPANVTVSDKTVSVKAKFTVNRTDWGIKFGTSEADPAEWMISKDIEIGVDVKASKL